MKIFAGIATPETKEEEYVMADIELKLIMSKAAEAEKLAKENNLTSYYEMLLKERKQGI